jgi:hypothetical protein
LFVLDKIDNDEFWLDPMRIVLFCFFLEGFEGRDDEDDDEDKGKHGQDGAG